MRYVTFVISFLLFVTDLTAQEGRPGESGGSSTVTVQRRAPKQPAPLASENFEAVDKSPGSVSSSAVPSLDLGARNIPSDFKPKTDVTLPATGTAAVNMSERWRAEMNTPAPGPDGRVLYAYGAGLPIIVCAPLRICIVEFEPGEHLVGVPHIGDSVRWRIAPATYGKANAVTTVLVLKPQESGLDTTLLVTTDRRAYYLRLVSKPEDYTARVAFEYPEQESAEEWKAFLSQAQDQAKRQDEPPRAPIESMNFQYTIRGDQGLLPVQIFDDGEKTFIRMNPKTKYREAPALVVMDADNKPEMLNFRVKDDIYIVDRLFDHAELVLGTGKKARKVEIFRDSAKKN